MKTKLRIENGFLVAKKFGLRTLLAFHSVRSSAEQCAKMLSGFPYWSQVAQLNDYFVGVRG